MIKFNGLLSGLLVNEKRMFDNIFYGGGLVFSQRLLLKLTGPAGDRDKAYRMVQRNALSAADGKGRFDELVKKDAEIGQFLSTREIDECFDISYYTRRVPVIFKRVFAK